MGILSGPEIVRQMELGNITLDPFNPKCVGSNSYDLHLSDRLLVYDEIALSTRRKPRTVEVVIPPDGYTLQPGRGYLGCTVERIGAHGFVPMVDGRSSGGRLFVQMHQTAGRGDDGWVGNFTLEITANALPVTVFPGDRLAQVWFLPVVGERKPYRGRYLNDAGPAASRLWQGEGPSC